MATIKADNIQPKRKIPIWGWVIIVLFGIGFLSPLSTTKTEKTSTDSTKSVNETNKQTQAKVNFTGTKFEITNINDFDWIEAEIIINEKYRYKAGNFKAGSTYGVRVGELIDRQNNRLNPFETKPKEIRIYVKNPISDDWYGELN